MTATLTPSDLKRARHRLGELWGLGRPLSCREMGVALKLASDDPGEAIRGFERGKGQISGPMSVAVRLMLTGAVVAGMVPDAERPPRG